MKKNDKIERKKNRRDYPGLWKNFKDTYKRARFFFKMLEMIAIEGNVPNRGVSFLFIGFCSMKGSEFDDT